MRRARQHIPGAVHHLIWRCLNRQWLIKTDEHRARYLYWLGRALKETDWKCVAYAIMSNHIHIAAIAGDDPLAAWTRRLHSPWVAWMNWLEQRLGPFFAERCNDHVPGEIGAANLIGYVHNNPVRANVVRHARDSDWTSHQAYIGVAPRPEWLDVEQGLRIARTPLEGFDDYVEGRPPKPERPPVKRISHVALRHGQVNVATPQDDSVPLVVRPYARVRIDPRVVVRCVGHLLGIDVQMIASRRRSAELIGARKVVAHAGAQLGLSNADIASVLGISAAGVNYVLRSTPPTSMCNQVAEMLTAHTLTADTLWPLLT